MKIAVIDHILNPGGGSRFCRSLLAAMKDVRPELSLTLFANVHGVEREGLRGWAGEKGVFLRDLSSTKWVGKDLWGLRGSRHLIDLVQNKCETFLSPFPYAFSGQLHKELREKIRGFDLAFFPWPFHLRLPSLSCPMVGVFHDLNFRYLFGGDLLLPWMQKRALEEMPLLLEKMRPVVSTEHMKKELEKFYPDVTEKVHVIPIAPFICSEKIDAMLLPSLRKRFAFSERYLLVPTHSMVHKNLGPLFSAFYRLRLKGRALSLVLVGKGTEIYNGRACEEGIEKDMLPQDVFGLGYVSNEEIDALIASSLLVVNPSLYEGGNGPGFDAWRLGVPVAMSDIPVFREHLATHDVKAVLFHPRNPEDIAEKLASVLDHPLLAKEDASHSKKAMASCTWERSAAQYLNLFDELVNEASACL